MPTIQIEKEQLLNAVLQMPRNELEEFVRKVFSLKAREHTPTLSERESELLLQINRGLPAQTRKRLNELIEKRQSHTIQQDELQELRQLTDQIEKSDAERLKWLIDLAALRNLPLDDLINQLGLKPYPHD
ncbi:MAG: STAS/SEC14 domain-containing protein [Pyrinomonadaceae bacterium]